MKLANNTRDALVSEAVKASEQGATARQTLGKNERRFFLHGVHVLCAVLGLTQPDEMDGAPNPKAGAAEFDKLGGPVSAAAADEFKDQYRGIMAAARKSIVDSVGTQNKERYFSADGMERTDRAALSAAGNLPIAVELAHQRLEACYSNTSRTNKVVGAILKGAAAEPEFFAYFREFVSDVRMPSSTLHALASGKKKEARTDGDDNNGENSTTSTGAASTGGENTPDIAPAPDSVERIVADLAGLRDRAMRLGDAAFAEFAAQVAAMLTAAPATEDVPAAA